MKNLSQFINSANTPQNTGGGTSHSSTVVTPVWKGSRPTVSRRSTDSQPKEHRTHTLLCKALKYAAMILMALTLGVGNAWGATFVEKWQNGKNESTKDLIATFTLGTNASISSSRIQIGNGNTGSFTWTIPTGYTITSVKFVMNSTDNRVSSFTATNGTVTNTATKEWTYTPSASNIRSETFTVSATGAAVQVSEVWVTFTDGVSDAAGDYESLYPVSADSSTPKNVTFTSSAATTSVTSITTEGSGVNNKCVQVANNQKVVITASKNIKYILFSWNKYAPSADSKWEANSGSYAKATYKWTPANTTTKSVTFTRKESNTAEISNIHIVYYASAAACGETEQAALSLSASSGTICGTGSTTFTVSGGSGTGALSVATSDPSKATASIDGSTVTVTGVAAGSATITVTKACDATYAEKTATYSATVAAVPTANAGADKVTEPGTGVALAATAAADGCTGAWTIVSGPNTATSQLSSTSSATATFTPTLAGTYTLRWTVTNTSTTCSAYAEMKVTAAICSISECGNATITYAINGGSSGDHSEGGADLISSATASNTTALGASTTIGYTGISMSSLGKKAAAAASACYPSKPNMSGKIGVYNGAAYNSSNYLQFAFTVKTGYTFTPCDIEFTVQPVDVATNFRWEVTDGTNVYGYGTATDVPKGSDGGASVLTGLTSTAEMAAGTYYIRLYPYVNAASKTFRISNDVILKGTTAEAAPASGYAITKSETNGTIAVTDGSSAITSAESGDDVYIAATPATGYGFTSWSVYKTDDAETTVTLADDDDTDNKTRKFTMPAYPITVGATFTAIDYTVTHSAATGGSYTIKVGDAEPVSTNTTANYGQTVTLAASPNSGYSFAGWTVMQGETPVSVSSNQFTMPAGNVTISASFAQEPNVYYYKNASRYDGETYKNPEGNDAGSDDNTALTTPWTICNACVTGVTKVEATAARYDGKGNHMNAYIKLRQSDGGKIVFTIASGYKATIKIKMGGYSDANTNITMKLNDSGDNISYSGTMSGAGTTENGYAELTYANLAAGAYTLKPTSGSLYISQIDIQTTAVYTLTYDANGGTGTMDNTVGTGTVTLRTNTYTKSGCTFQGWATSQDNANAGTVAYADGATDYNLSANATLYAVWKLNAPTISCAANVVTMSAMSGAAIYYTTDGETTPTSSSTLYNSSSKPQIAANTTFKAIAILENYVSSDVTTQTCEYVAPATVDDLVTIDADYTFTPSAAMTANTLYESDKIIAIGDGNSYNSSGLQIKENRAIAFKVANNAKVKVTFTTNGDREMQLGTATTDDDNKEYGHTKTSPAVFEVSTGGVVYLTASSDLYMTKLEVMYPHTVTYALGDGTGTLPTESAHYNGEQFYVHDGVTNITAPENKEFSVWSDGTSTYAGGAQYTMGSSNVTLTAKWITALPFPTITFNDGAYTIAGDALNLSSLFSSNSDGAVTYTVKTAGATGATIDGTSFTATAAGSATVTASQAATASYKAKSVDATITVSAPTEPEGVKLVEDNTLTGNFRSSRTLSDGSCIVAGINYSKYVTMGSTYTSWGPDAGPSGKYFSYTVQKKSTRFYFYVNNTGSAATIHLYTSAEGSAAAATKNDIDVAAGTSLVTYNLATTTNTEVFIGVSSTNIRFCQIIAVESGDSHLTAPAVGYAMSLNKGRLSTASGTATTIDGLTFVVSSGYKPAYSTTAQIGTKGTHYVSFTIPTGQTRQLQLTTSNTAKYTVSKTLGDDENQITPTANTAANYNLEAGTWYINPQGSNVNITNIAFAAAPAQKSVTFKDGSTTLDTKYVWSGDAVTAMSPAPTKSGYRFVKWQLGGVDYDFATAVTDDIVLNAVWQQTWTVTFDSDGGSDVAAATVDNGAAVAKPADPTKVGFDFVEWQLNSAAYNFASTVTSNITLVATWVVAQTDASLSALSYNSNAIDVNSAVETEGVLTYTVHLQWGSTVDDDLISVTKSAETATVSGISYDSENLKATFSVESGNHTVTINYAIQFVIDAKRGTSIVKAVVSGGDQKAGFAATGIYGDKGYAYTRNNKKLDTADKFVGVKLISGKTFATGDKLFVVTSTDADMGYIEIYEEAEGTNLIKATGVRDASEGIEVPELAGYSEFYIVRKASTGDQAWNGFVDYVEVTREMNPAIKSFKFGDDAATINESAKTISIEVPYATDVTALTPTVEAYGNNGATYTPAGATDFTSPVDYVVTDGYSEFNTTYAVTVNVADPSENAYLASLSVAGYALDFNKEVEEYDIVLDYGTTVLPTITYAVEDAGLAEAEKVEGGVSGATTITVTPQAGAGYEKVYTINFSVSTMPKFVIFDGSKMTDYSESGSNLGTGFAWTVVGGSHSEKSAGVTLNGKIYAKGQNIFGSPTASNTRYIEITIPEGYMAKFYLAGATNSKDDMRSSFISKEKTGTLDESIAYVSSDQYSGAYMESDYQFPGTYYYCSDASIRLYELSITLYSIDYTRETTPGRIGTICLEKGGVMRGAAVYEVAYFNPDNQKIYFDEVLNGEMVPGMPYVFLPDEGNNNQLVVMYGNNAAAAKAGHQNGLYGSFSREELTPNDGNYIFSENKYWFVNSDEIYVGKNRAYLKVEEIYGYEGEPEPAPAVGRRRVSMGAGAQAPNTTTGFDQITNDQSPITNKVLINGQLFILRGQKLYDATGRLVK